MSILLRKQKEVYKVTGIVKLSIVGLISGLAFAMISTIWAVYLYSFLNSTALVGFFTAGITLVSLISFFIFVPLIQKISKSKIYIFSLALYVIIYFLFAMNTRLSGLVILTLISAIVGTLVVTSFGIIIKHNSNKKELSKNEGLRFVFANIAFLIGPLIAGYLSSKHGINLVFLLASIFIFIAILFFRKSRIEDNKIKRKTEKNVLKNFIEFFKNKNRRLAYIIGGGVSFWWSLNYIFMPLFIIKSGLDKIWVGYFLFAIVIPLVLFEYPIAKLAGKIGFKKIFKIGYLIAAITSIACFFIPNIYAIMGTLVLASIGLAMLEPTLEAHFFDNLKKGESSKYYGPYNTKANLNAIISRTLAAFILIFLSFKYVFLLFGLAMLVFAFISSKLKEIVENKQ